MIRWGLFFLAVISNSVWVVASVDAEFVTWAQVVPIAQSPNFRMLSFKLLLLVAHKY